MRRALAILAAVILALSPSHAQTVEIDAALVEAARNNLIEIERLDDGSLAGPGYDRLIADADEAQFFLIGEQHATADIGEIATAMHRDLAGRGYHYMAMEIGPWSTAIAETMLRGAGDVIEAIRSAPGGGFALPFLFFAEDARLAEQGIALSPAVSDVLWGLDQEFIAAGPLLLPDLRRLANSTQERETVADFAEALAANPMTIGAAEPDRLIAMRDAFAVSGNAEGAALADALVLSNRIYRPFTGRGSTGYQANLERENYMKRNFLDHFERIAARDGAPPRVFFKFGANHMMRGRSLTNVPALGDFLVEWGRARDFGVVNMMIDCLGGEAADVRSGEAQPCESYALGEDSLIARALDDRPLALIDLRALRPLIRRDTAIDEASRTLIFAFDYYLGVRDVSAATVIPPPMQLPQ